MDIHARIIEGNKPVEKLLCMSKKINFAFIEKNYVWIDPSILVGKNGTTLLERMTPPNAHDADNRFQWDQKKLICLKVYILIIKSYEK